jgi:hypothetical protein
MTVMEILDQFSVLNSKYKRETPELEVKQKYIEDRLNYLRQKDKELE